MTDHPDAPTGHLSPADFRRALGQFATGITVVTARDEANVPLGATVSSFASLSLNPPLIQWSLGTNSYSFPLFSRSTHFAINILSSDQEETSRNFCRPIDRFASTETDAGLHGLPLIRDCLAWIECQAEQQITAGDHTIFIGRVLRARTFDKTPLLNWRGAYMPVREWSAAARVAALGGHHVAPDLEELMCLM